MPALIENEAVMSSKQKGWEWQCLVPKKSFPRKILPLVEAQDHPLKSSGISFTSRGLKNIEKLTASPSLVNDPLLSALDGVDPLSALAAETDWDEYDPKTKAKPSKERPNPWTVQRLSILNKYTTTKKVSMATGIISGVDKSGAANREAAGKGTPTGIRYRLEQLDDFEEVNLKEIAFYTQQEYTENIKELNKELCAAWNQDMRVKALKIAIQCSKLLVDTSVVQFYPSKFVLITDVLDEFGALVYDRLSYKASNNLLGCLSPVTSGFNSVFDLVEVQLQSQGWIVHCFLEFIGTFNYSENSFLQLAPVASDSAKETCRNWFYKIASIRELIPRLYLEAAVLKSYDFLSKTEFAAALKRLTGMVRGIGDPLVAAYARCYLCRIALSAPTLDEGVIKDNFDDFLSTYPVIFSPSVQAELSKQKVDMGTYLMSYVPALDWIMKTAVDNQHSSGWPILNLDYIVDKCCTQSKKKTQIGLLLYSILNTFNEAYVASRALFFIEQISLCKKNDFPLYILLKQLGDHLKGRTVSSHESISRDFLIKGIKLISELTDPTEYLTCVSSWTSFIVKNSQVSEINEFLGDIIAHVTVPTDQKNHFGLLHDIIMSIVKNLIDGDPDLIFTLDKFLPLLDTFGNDEKKAVTARKILELLMTHSENRVTDDPVTKNMLIYIAKILHDSVNVMTVDDEKRQIGALISQIMRSIDFGTDVEKQLSFYVEARGTFTSLDSVVVCLIHCVNRLAMETGKRVKSRHTRKTAAFVHACAAYSFITIPSIMSETSKLLLYLLTAQVALFNQCLSQADACIKAALTLVLDLPKYCEIDSKSVSTDPFLQEYVKNMLSTLIILPDCPDQGVLHLTRGLVNVLQQYSDENNSYSISFLLLKAIEMLTVAAQPEYPYRVKNVDSNDVLYGNDPKFINEINKMCSVMLDQVLGNLKKLGSNDDYKTQAKLGLDCFLTVVIHSNLESGGMLFLARQLWKLATKDNSKHLESVKIYLKRRSDLYPADSSFSQLAQEL